MSTYHHPRVPESPVFYTRPDQFAAVASREASLAFALGQYQQRHRPTRRGDLPDVDFTAVFVPRRTLWSRLVALFRAPSTGAQAPVEVQLELPLEEPSNPASGKTNEIPYRRAA